MHLTEQQVDAILMGNSSLPIEYRGEWVLDIEKELETIEFVVVAGGYYKGIVQRQYIENANDDEDNLLIYSHEGVGLDLVKVKRSCIKKSGTREVIFEEC